MDRLRKSFRESFRKKKEHVPESSKPHQWQADEQAVRMGSCSFPVKYLGCVEVFESRGMQVCEEALKVLKSKTTRRRPLKATLHVTGDGLRVVDDETKGLVVDQTIEKVSFCAPDRNHERGFSYICRDGTTRRWLCHGFHATKDSGERLSHAVGCAFAVCLERKQKRDKDINNVTMNFDNKTSTFTRCGSFRQSSITDRLHDPQVAKPSAPPPVKSVNTRETKSYRERPHATPQLLQRQGSFRGLGSLNQASPFKRQLSLRINELPSNVERQRAQSLSNDIFSRPGTASVAPISEAISSEKTDTISEMCKELSQGLKLLSSNEDPFTSPVLSPSSDTMPINNLGKDDKSGTSINWSGTSSIVTSTTCPVLSEQCISPPPTSTDFRNIPLVPPRRSSPNFSQLRSQSLVNSEGSPSRNAWRPSGTSTTTTTSTGAADRSPARNGPNKFTRTASFDAFKERTHDSFDPFDAEWVCHKIPVAPRSESNNQVNSKSTNPFAPFTQTSSAVKAFEVQL